MRIFQTLSDWFIFVILLSIYFTSVWILSNFIFEHKYDKFIWLFFIVLIFAVIGHATFF